MKLAHFFKLVRITNMPTAVADVMAGFFLSVSLYSLESRGWQALILTAFASACVYSGGMANNDAQHVAKDRLLSKPRPVVAGDMTPVTAWAVSLILFAMATFVASRVGVMPALVVVAIALMSMLYNRLARGTIHECEYREPSKWANLAGAIVLGACRSLNLGLGVAAALTVASGGEIAFAEMLEALPLHVWALLVSVFVYFLFVIGASLLEDFGGGVRGLKLLLRIVPLIVFFAPLAAGYASFGENLWDQYARLVVALIAAVILSRLLVLRLLRAIADPRPPVIGQVVRWGIIGEPLFLAAFVAMCLEHSASTMSSVLLSLVVASMTLACLALSRLSHST